MPSPYTTRERFSERTPYIGLSWIYAGAKTPTTWCTTQDWESVTSRRNGFYSDNRCSDKGGDFTHVKFTDYRETSYMDLHYGGNIGGNRAYNYVGPFNILGNSPTVASHRTTVSELSMSAALMQTQGTRFISEASPTAPKAGITTALYEIKREGLPSMASKVVEGLGRTGPWVRRIKAPVKGSGSDYLNWQFGWLPVVSDVRKLAESAMKADELLRHLYRDSGKVVRRKRGNPDFTRVINQSSSESNAYGCPTMGTGSYASITGGKQFTSTETTRSMWFSGAFMYHLPESVTSLGKLRSLASDARYLYGISVSPIDVWNLIPFSWLADWVVNTGDVISNISDQLYNKQVLKYGYMMAHTTRTTYTHGTIKLVDGFTHVPRATQVYDIKQRIQATPFGFGLNWDGFSAYQLSILAALGISRGR